jgi:hypothetical protein
MGRAMNFQSETDFGNTPMAERGTAINTAKPEGRR